MIFITDELGKGKGRDIAGIQNCGIRYLPESVYDV